jgi:LysM repeat protein
MSFKILLSALVVFAASLSLSAKPVIDSVGVKSNDGKKMILFKVKAKDTYYSIGRHYHISPEALMKFNGSKKTTLSIGTIVEIPTEIPFKKSEKTEKAEKKEKSEQPEKLSKKEKKEKAEREAKEEREAGEKKSRKHTDEDNTDDKQASSASVTPTPAPIMQQPVVQQQPVAQPPVQQVNTPPTQYKVSAGETLYSIAKRFNTTVDNITKMNNLSSTTLQPGQLLQVPSGQPVAAPQAQSVVSTPPPAPVVAKRDSTATTSVAIINKDSSSRVNPNRFGLFEKNEKGVATWMDDPGLDPNKKLVLHRTAPVGTVIKITNPMTNRTTFAKVVGRFTDTEATKDVVIVMTKNVADALGAVDKRFHVELSYGSPNE